MALHTNTLTDDAAIELLHQACARSVVLELHRQEGTLVIPAARARLLTLTEDGLILDRPQVIGREVPLGAGQKIDAYFAVGDDLYTFQTMITGIDLPVQINPTTVIKGARLETPRVIKVGQRRQHFRTSLALIDPLPVAIHLTDPDEPCRTPIDAPHFKGLILDASGGGFGVRIDGAVYTRFKIYDHYFLTFTTPEQNEETTVLAELRQTRSIRNDESAKLGFLTLPWPSQRDLDRRLQPLVRFLTEMQRRARRAG